MLRIIRKRINLLVPKRIKAAPDAPATKADKNFKIIVFIILCGKIIFMLLS